MYVAFKINVSVSFEGSDEGINGIPMISNCRFKYSTQFSIFVPLQKSSLIFLYVNEGGRKEPWILFQGEVWLVVKKKERKVPSLIPGMH